MDLPSIRRIFFVFLKDYYPENWRLFWPYSVIGTGKIACPVLDQLTGQCYESDDGENFMRIVGLVIVALIALLHFYIAWFEIFAWTTRGPEIFKSIPAELFEPTTVLAANQGIYNAFLAAGLTWSLLIKDAKWKINIAVCFLLFVAIAGVFGAATADFKIFYVQTVPAAAALFCLLLSRRSVKS